MKPRGVGALLCFAAAAATAGCSGEEQTAPTEATVSTVATAPATRPSATGPSASTSSPTEPVSTPSTTPLSDDTTVPPTSSVPGGDSAGPTPISDALGALPSAVRSSGNVEVTYIDWDRIARSRGIGVIAEAGDSDEARDRLVEVVSDVPVERGGEGFGVLQAFGFPDSTMYSRPDEIESELGFSLYSVRSMTAVVVHGATFSVLEGDLPINPELDVDEFDVYSAGDLPDDQTDVDGRTAARPLGRTLHLARDPEDPSRLAVTRHRPLLEGWPAAGRTLADVPIYAEAAAALDRFGATTALLIEDDFTPIGLPVGEIEASVHITEPFRLVAIGAALLDGDAVTAVIYQFDDAAAAQRGLDGVERAWLTGESIVAPGTLVSEMVEVRSVELLGGSVRVVLGTRDDRTTTFVPTMLYQQEAVFLHR